MFTSHAWQNVNLCGSWHITSLIESIHKVVERYIRYIMMFVTIIYYRTTSMAYVYPTLLGSCTFWLLSLVLILACLVPDCTFSVLQNYTPAAYAKHKKVQNRFNKSLALSYDTSVPWVSDNSKTWLIQNSRAKKIVWIMNNLYNNSTLKKLA
jgi:hypothetical protein